MPANAAPTIAILDLGTFKTSVLIAEIRDGALSYLGHGTASSRGLQKGLVIEIEAAVPGIKEAVEIAEQSAETSIERVYVSFSGAHIRGVNCQAGLSLASRNREITRDDLRHVIEETRAVALPDDREVIHVLRQEFVLDAQSGVREPLGMLASRLEARVHLITASTTAKQNLVLTVNRAGLEVEEVVFPPLAVAESMLKVEERELGIALVDIGAGSTGIAVYQQGTLRHTSVLGIGGQHFTNDIAVGLSTPPGEAEKIKQAFGFAAANYVHDGNAIEVPSVGGRPSRLLEHRKLCDCIEPRARELLQLLDRDLNRAGVRQHLGAGLIFTGGAAKLAGFQEVAEILLDRPVRLCGAPPLDGLPDALLEPEYAFLVSGVYYAHRRRVHSAAPPPRWQRLWQKFVDRFDEDA